MQMQIVIATS